jgi:hypothetical protein
MDMLINIIITAAIVLFILRRMYEVARKGKDITGPPLPESMFGEDDEEPAPRTRRVETMGEPPARPRRFETAGGPVPGPLHEAPTVPRRFSAPAEPPAPRRRMVPSETVPEERGGKVPKAIRQQRDERDFESADEEESRIRESEGEILPVHTAAPELRRAHRADTDRGPGILLAPCFSRKGLVQGIIMREVLGPPVGMRNQG